jgi:alkylhydroperoxidase family enzyme
MLPERVKAVIDKLFAPGRLDEKIRRAAFAGEALPAPLKSWVDKVIAGGHGCSDEDVAAMKAAGYSEDQIFEVTLAAAVGAGASRFERGLSLLRGGR